MYTRDFFYTYFIIGVSISKIQNATLKEKKNHPTKVNKEKKKVHRAKMPLSKKKGPARKGE